MLNTFICSLYKNTIIHTSYTDKKIRLFTLAPQTCSRNPLPNFFWGTDYLVSESHEILTTTGILVEIAPKR